MKKLRALILFIFCFVSVLSAQIKVNSFEELAMDLDASTVAPKKDQNNKTCAIIKIFTTQKGFNFDVGILGITAIEYKTAEIWLYVPEKVRKIKITHPQLGHIENGESDGYYWLPTGVKSGKSYKLDITTGKGNRSENEVKIQTGWLIIESDPSEAELYIEDNGSEHFMGITPFQKKMLYGRYNYRIKKTKYHDEVGVATVDNTRTVISAKLVPAFGTIYITSEPAGAKVYLDGDYTSMVTPCVIKDVLSGSHSIRLQKEDYAPQVQQVTVRDGVESNVSFQLESMFSVVEIKSLEGAKIKVNGEHCGETSCKLNLQEGFYEIEVSLEKHKSVKKTIEVIARQTESLELNPIPVYGSLDVITIPRNAKIFIDGVGYGDTPNTIENLPIGEYEVKLNLPGYGMEKRKVLITENTTAVVNVTFNKQNKKNNTIEQKTRKELISSNKKKKAIIEKTPKENVELIKPKVVRYKLEHVKWNDSVTETQKIIIKEIIENMIKVEGGTFVMGTTKEQDSESEEDERIPHNVFLNDFCIGKYEIKQREWAALMGYNPSKFKGDNKPVENVSWYDCKMFIDKLNRYTGFKFRLPTEAEWEYAARGGNKTNGYKYSGDTILKNVAWVFEQGKIGTHPVGLKKSNELGLYDLSGNVYEWCEDWYDVYLSRTENNPQGAVNGRTKVFRGGCWNNFGKQCRVTYRCNDFPKSRFSYIGFRLVLGLD